MWTHLADRHDEPERGDEILHIDPLGEPNGLSSRVKSVVSSDHIGGVAYFEVVDNFNAVRIIKHFDDTSWIITEDLEE